MRSALILITILLLPIAFPKATTLPAERLDSSHVRVEKDREVVTRELNAISIARRAREAEKINELTKTNVISRFRLNGVTTDSKTLERIISIESGWDFNSKAPTYWSQCSDGRFIELRKYSDGRMWQAKCSDYGLGTIETGYSHGLMHIIEPTRREFKCNEVFKNWMEEVDCASKIINAGGITRWASYWK